MVALPAEMEGWTDEDVVVNPPPEYERSGAVKLRLVAGDNEPDINPEVTALRASGLNISDLRVSADETLKASLLAIWGRRVSALARRASSLRQSFVMGFS